MYVTPWLCSLKSIVRPARHRRGMRTGRPLRRQTRQVPARVERLEDRTLLSIIIRYHIDQDNPAVDAELKIDASQSSSTSPEVSHDEIVVRAALDGSGLIEVLTREEQDLFRPLTAVTDVNDPDDPNFQNPDVYVVQLDFSTVPLNVVFQFAQHPIDASQ